MKKYRKLLVLILVCVLALTGCGTEEAAVTEPAVSDSNQTGPLMVGNQMPELTVTTAQGETLLLSKLLQQKKMVLLNFWFEDCIWCRQEFPVMEVSYQRHKDNVEILALNPIDTAESVAAFQKDHSLNFPMAKCSRDLALTFGVGSYPTSVVIDRDGRISLIHTGAITQTEIFDQLFETFTADDYTFKPYHSINDL